MDGLEDKKSGNADVYEVAKANADEIRQQGLSQKEAFVSNNVEAFNLKASGLNAENNLIRFDEQNARLDKSLQPVLGTADFALYMENVAPNRLKERENLVKMVTAETKVALDQNNVSSINEEASRFAAEDALTATADYAVENQAEIDRHKVFSSALDTADDMMSDVDKLIDDNPNLTPEQKEQYKAIAKHDLTIAKGAAGQHNNANQEEIKKQAATALEKRRVAVRDGLANKTFASRYSFLKSQGYDDLAAFAIAKQCTRETVKNHFKSMAARGLALDCITMLDGFEADVKNSFAASRKKIDANGKEINTLGEIDPRAGAYLTLDDIVELRKAAYQGLDDAINENKRKAQRIQDGLLTDKIAVKEKIDKHFANINLADGTVGMTNERRDAQYKEIWNEIKKLDDAGLDDAGALFLKLSNGTLVRQKYSESTRRKLELEAARNKKAMTKAELQAQEARLKENIKRLIENPTAKEKVKLERNGEDGKPQVYEVEMSANEMIQMYIEIARMNDLCKGDEWTKIYKEHGNAERNLAIVNQVMNEMFEFPVKESSFGSKKKGEWGDRAEGSGTMLTFALADHAGVKCTNVYGEGMRVKTKQGNPLSFWGNEKPDWITGTVISEMVAQGVKYLNDFAPADGQKAIEAIRQFWGESLKKARLEKDCTAMQNAMIRNLTQGLDYMRSGQVSGGMVGGKLRFAKGNVTRRQIHEMAMLTDIGQNVKTAQKNYNTAAQNYDIMLEAAKDNAAEQQYINGISLETE